MIDLPSGWSDGVEIPASSLNYSAITQGVVNISKTNGKLTASGQGSTVIEVKGEYNGVNYFGTFTVSIEGTSNVKKDPTITLPATRKIDHLRNDGFVNGEHSYSEYTIFANNSGFYPAEMEPAIEVEMVVDQDWYAKYGWNEDYLATLDDEKAEEYHRTFHLSYPGYPKAEFENNSILHLYANIAGVYNIKFKFPESENFNEAEHTMQLSIVPDLYQHVYIQDIGIQSSGSYELVKGVDYSNKEIFTSYIGELYYNITYKTQTPETPVAYLASETADATVGVPEGMTRYTGRVNLNNADSMELATRVNGILSTTRKINFVNVDTPTGVDNIEAAGAEAEYFNLQGIKVSMPLAPGIYVKVENGVTSKVLVK